jgi:hypothetical protein
MVNLNSIRAIRQFASFALKIMTHQLLHYPKASTNPPVTSRLTSVSGSITFQA